MRLARFLGLVGLALLLLWPAGANAERRVALVIGNGAYEHTWPLRNPGNDAQDITAALEALGFDVIHGRDLTRGRTEQLLRDFGRRADGADTTLVFYAGHGLQVDGENWIVPVDARLQEDRDLPFEAVSLATLMRTIEVLRHAS